MPNGFYKNLGAKLRAYRKTRQITLQQLSNALNKSVATISKYEKGEIAVDLEILIDWCRFLNIDIASLLPGTQRETSDLERYQKHYIDRLYLYSFMGHKNKIHFDAIENDNTTMKSTLYLDVHDADDIYSCGFVYSGRVIYSDISTSFVFFNTSPPFDMVTCSMPTLSESQDCRIGMLSSISFYYRNIAIKVLASKTPVSDQDFLMEKLLLTQDELKDFKQFNFFII